MRERMPDDNMVQSRPELDADAYERRAAIGVGASRPGAFIKVATIAVSLALVGGAVALTASDQKHVAGAQQQQFAAADSRQIEPQQLQATPAPAPDAPAARVAENAAPKSAPRPPAAAPAPKPRAVTPSPAPAPEPIAPPAAVSPPAPATPTAIPEIAPSPAEIAPEAAPAGTPPATP